MNNIQRTIVLVLSESQIHTLPAQPDRATSLPPAARLARARHLIVDLDGTLIREDELLPGAAELLARFAGRYTVVSNNSTHTAPGVARRLRRLGLQVAPREVLLAGEHAVQHLRRHHAHAGVLLVGSAMLRRHALARGCRLVDDAPDIVLLALDPRFNTARLQQVANALRGGASLVVSNVDANHPGPGGAIVPETGALLAAVTAASGVVPLQVLGKPEPGMLLEALRRMDARADSTIVIGDNPATDAAGALRAGMDCIVVGPGAHAEVHTLEALWERAASPLPSVALQR